MTDEQMAILLAARALPAIEAERARLEPLAAESAANAPAAPPGEKRSLTPEEEAFNATWRPFKRAHAAAGKLQNPDVLVILATKDLQRATEALEFAELADDPALVERIRVKVEAAEGGLAWALEKRDSYTRAATAAGLAAVSALSSTPQP